MSFDVLQTQDVVQHVSGSKQPFSCKTSSYEAKNYIKSPKKSIFSENCFHKHEMLQNFIVFPRTWLKVLI